jgi:hypothetical protein
MSANNLTSGLRGPNNLIFADGTHIRYNTIDFKLGGTVMGDRTIEATGSILFEDLNNGLRAIVQLGTYQKTGMVFKKITGSKDEITGFIYRSSQVPMKPTEFGPN